MIRYSDEDIERAIKESKKGLALYKEIIKLFNNNVDVSKDETFQRLFNGFFITSPQKPDFYLAFYSYFETIKSNIPSFTEALEALYKNVNRVQTSFISKMFHVIDNNLPIYDGNMLKVLNIDRPKTWWSLIKKKERAIEIYNQIIQWYNDFVPSEEGQRWIILFDKEYSNSNITPIKKIDFILWKLGKK